MPDVTVALDAAARQHQFLADRLATGIELTLFDLFLRLGREYNVSEWVAIASSRLEAGAAAYADLASEYVRTQLTLLSPDPPEIVPPDLGWVSSDLDHWLPAPMVEVAARVADGEDVTEVLADVVPQVEREVSAFVNEVEARTVVQTFNQIGDFVTFDSLRPTMELQAEIEQGLVDLEDYANAFSQAGYRVSKSNGKHLSIQILPQIGACGFCVVRADRLYTTAVLHDGRIRSHTSCRCGWRTVTEQESNTFHSVLRGEKATAIIDRRASPDPNVPAPGDLTNE